MISIEKVIKFIKEKGTKKFKYAYNLEIRKPKNSKNVERKNI